MTYVGESNSTPSNVRLLSREGVRNDWRDEKTDGAADCSHTSCWPCHDPIFITPSWFSAPRGLALPTGSRPDYWRNELLYRGDDIERHPGPKRALPLRGRDVLVPDVLPTTAQRHDLAGSEFEKYLRVRDSHGLDHGLNELGHVCIQYLRTCFALGSLGPQQAGTLLA